MILIKMVDFLVIDCRGSAVAAVRPIRVKHPGERSE